MTLPTALFNGDDREALADLADLIFNTARELRFQEVNDPAVIRLTPSDGNVMRFIHRHPGATPSQIAEATGLQRSNLSAALRTLEANGLVVRQNDPQDGRGIRLHPTAEADRNLRLLRAEWARRFANALGDDSAGLDETTHFLTRLEAGLVARRQMPVDNPPGTAHIGPS